jgi:hypothetical protein
VLSVAQVVAGLPIVRGELCSVESLVLYGYGAAGTMPVEVVASLDADYLELIRLPVTRRM